MHQEPVFFVVFFFSHFAIECGTFTIVDCSDYWLWCIYAEINPQAAHTQSIQSERMNDWPEKNRHSLNKSVFSSSHPEA